MSSRLILTSGKVGIVAGLSWSDLTTAQESGRKRRREISDLTTSAQAKWFSLVTVHGEQAAGAAASDAAKVGVGSLVDDVPSRTRLYSLCSMVAGASQGGNVIVAWALNEKVTAVCAVAGGLPMIDKVLPVDEASAFVASLRSGSMGVTDWNVLSNVADQYPAWQGQMLDAATLLGLAGPTSQLRAAPTNWRLVVLASVAVLACVAAAYAWTEYKDQRERERIQREKAAANLTPKYLKVLDSQLSQMGLDRSSLIKLHARLQQLDVWVAGWQLSRVSCTQAGACTAEWARKGGTIDVLLKAFPQQRVMPDPNIERAILQWDEPVESAGLTNAAEIQSTAAEMEARRPIQQLWTSAGLAINVAGAAVPWPPTPGIDVSKVNKAVLVSVRKVDVKVPTPLAADAINGAPPSIFWHSVTLDLGTDAKSAVTTTLHGNVFSR